MRQFVRQLCQTFDDPHEFATAYARHVDEAHARGVAPLPVEEAAIRFHRREPLP